MNALRSLSSVIFCLCLATTASALAENRVQNHPSPYLAMHGQDPVQWQLWDQSALDQARRDNKLLFVSIGYFSCHWCHVMHRESYSDPMVAKALNEGFVPVKVDRELQPALDAHLIEFVQATRGYAGWPLNVFLTPAGNPLIGMTYLPRDEFLGLLGVVRERWAEREDELNTMAANAARILYQRPQDDPTKEIAATHARLFRDGFVQQSMQLADRTAGGFGETTKFPSVPQLRTLLTVYDQTRATELKDYLELTLAQMATQGLRDHLSGGFFRYTTDPNWQIPHFEKMLYDNALLSTLYLEAAELLDNPRLEEVARSTLDFMLNVMWSEEGAFIASLSAVDVEGVEGGYYLWDEDTFERVLTTEESDVVKRAWRLARSPELESGGLPVLDAEPQAIAAAQGISVDRVGALLSSARSKLLIERATRQLPADDKLLAGWNGLALSALVGAARRSHGETYALAAGKLKAYIEDRLWDGVRLLRARSDAGAFGSASLEDYAYVGRGLVDWATLSGDPSDMALAAQVLSQGWARYHSAQGWRLAEDILIPYADGEPVLTDGAMPSASSVLLGATFDLRDAASEALREQAEKALRAHSEMLSAAPYNFASQVRMMLTYLRPSPSPQPSP